LNVDENLLAIIVMFLEFTISISLLVSFAIGVCISMKVVIGLRFEEVAPM
jgi:hypothetical protein